MRNPISRVSRRGRVTIVVLAVVFLLFTLFDRVIGAWTDYLWFNEVNYTERLQRRAAHPARACSP